MSMSANDLKFESNEWLEKLSKNSSWGTISKNFAGYSSNIVQYQSSKTWVKKLFGSYSKGTSGFKQVVWGFEKAKYSVPTFIAHLCYAREKAENTEQVVFGDKSKFEKGMLNVFKVYSTECMANIDHWIQKNSESVFETTDDPDQALKITLEGAKKEGCNVSEYLFNSAMSFFWEERDERYDLTQLVKEYGEWKRNLEENLRDDNDANEVIDFLNDNWISKEQQEEEIKKDEPKKRKKLTRTRRSKKTNNEKNDVNDNETNENIKTSSTTTNKETKEKFQEVGYSDNIGLIAKTVKTVKDAADREIIQIFKSNCKV
jgi:hypothetical protein